MTLRFKIILKYSIFLSVCLLSGVGYAMNSFIHLNSTKAKSHPIPITFWHSMAGKLGGTVDQIVGKFNRSQSQYKIIPIYKGDYPSTLMATVAAFRSHQQPDIVQIFEVGTGMMTNPPGVIVPLYQLVSRAGIKLDSKAFLPAIESYYADQKGRLVALPFNSSTPVMYLNRRAFKKAGLNPDKPPQTWMELANVGKKLLKAGYRCGFTTAWPSWIQLEAFSAWHNIPFASNENGFESIEPKLTYNNPIVIHHLSMLATWQKEKIFVYGGREDNAMSLFSSGVCPIIMESSGSRSGIKANMPFPTSVAAIPYWSDVKGAPQNMLIGGAALWAMTGHSENVYRGVAEFFAFLSKPKIQAQWQQLTGYLPVTKAAYQLSLHQGFYKKNPGALVPLKELMQKKPTQNSKGIRLGGYPQIRQINNRALESIFSGQKSPKQALDSAVEQGDRVLKQFSDNLK